jgi:CRISPR-associated protein Cas5t
MDALSSTLPVTRVTLLAPVAAFRDPFLVTGRIPSAPCPPPSTVYGLCSAALGDFPPRDRFFVGLITRHVARATDKETHHPAELHFGRATLGTSGLRKAIESTPNAVDRDFLYGVELELYLPRPIGAAFRKPVWPMLLGRSQDLAEVVCVEDLELEQRTQVSLRDVLLPMEARALVRRGSVLALSRFIGPGPDRPAEFERYIYLAEREDVSIDDPRIDLWADPSRPTDEEPALARGVWLLDLREKPRTS